MEHLSPALENLILVHRIIGYPLAFVIAPLALVTFAGRPPHRAIGIAFAVGMTLLYTTGSTVTLTQYDYASWEFGRNLSFNLLGYLFVAHGVRAIWLWRHADAPRPTALDHALRALLYGNVALLTSLAVIQNTPLRVFAILAIALVVLDRADWRAGFTRATLYARHARYILASYFYVLTVVSVVHLRHELPTNVRWLWPSLIGLAVLWIVQGANTPGHPLRTRAQRYAIAWTVAIALVFGTYAVYEVVRDGGARNPSRPRATAQTSG